MIDNILYTMRVADSVPQHPFHKCQGEGDTDARKQ